MPHLVGHISMTLGHLSNAFHDGKTLMTGSLEFQDLNFTKQHLRQNAGALLGTDGMPLTNLATNLQPYNSSLRTRGLRGVSLKARCLPRLPTLVNVRELFLTSHPTCSW